MHKIQMFFAAALLCAAPAAAQAPMTMPMPMPAVVAKPPAPDATPDPAPLMFMHDGWMLMLHGLGFMADQQQTGPRGGDKLFSTNWAMGMASHRWGAGKLTFRTMLSLEPATITGRQYPELFQVGETAFGAPIVDGQHPHNLFMELAALYDVKVGEHAALSFYAAPIGDPAVGPTAYPHRNSAADDPLAPLSHHLVDSTHIAADVLTMGATYRSIRIEGSAFHGREPGENRWAVLSGQPDSWSSRLTWTPGADWSGQFSFARIKSPEALQPTFDQLRLTASVTYNRTVAGGKLANTVAWGRTRVIGGRDIQNGYLLESNLGFKAHNHAWTRLENVDRTNELLRGENPAPANFVERPLGRVQALSLGYDRDLPTAAAWLATAAGVQWTYDHAPVSLRAVYGTHPQGLVVFLRFRLGAD